ncbi:Ig-like domain-containing protein [Paenibacillus aestuarii]|uniref:Ig-like domain-containing protein n=1 Tax=Paenibacillus aestuarii TaxID=516965 RepID=A0ABW0KBC1_9BACL|nr:Ig-like domain-containing protein [Paenibacillus aestuarii]
MYTNVFTGPDTNGQALTVDAVVTISKIDANAHINVFDLPDSTYDGRFNPVIYTDGTNGQGDRGVTFTVNFYKHSANLSLGTLGTADVVQLKDFYMTVIDIDGNSSALTEYVEASGFQSYQVDASTQLSVKETTGGRVQFRGISTSINGLVFDKSDSAIVYYKNPISSISLVGGNTGPLGSQGSTSQRQFSYDFGASGGVTKSVFTNGVTKDTPVAPTKPVVNSQSVTTAQDTPQSITLTGATADNGTLVYSVQTGPAHGTLGPVSGSTVTYTPAPGYLGTDSFTFIATNGTVASDPAVVSITVTQGNRTPVAASQSVDTGVNQSKLITLAGTDADGDNLTYAIGTGPAHGTLSAVSGTNVTYTPAEGYAGSDSFTFTAADGKATSAPAVVSITVTQGNRAPVAASQSVDTGVNQSKLITLAGTDADGDNLTYAIGTGPAHGTLSAVNGANVTYTPEEDYAGPDSFTFTAGDGKATSAPAVVSITVTQGNRAPVAASQSVDTGVNQSKLITLAGTDADGDNLTYAIGTGPAHGTLSAVNGANVTYTPEEDYAGPDSFTFTAADGKATSAPAMVSINVIQSNRAPVVAPQAVTTDENQAKQITLAGSDADGDNLTYAIGTGPAHGTLSAVNGTNVTYTPTAGYSGPDSFTYTASDGKLTSAPAAVTITVTAINHAPVADGQAVTTDEDQSKTITLSGTDPDENNLTYAIVTGPAHGTLGPISGANVTYTPAPNYNGADSFTFTVTDGKATSTPATVNITVTPVNDAPTASGKDATTAEDQSTDITLLGADVDNDQLTYAIATPPAHGTVTIQDNVATYTPAPNYNGADSFTLTVTDGKATSDPATVNITVTPVNDKPVGNPQTVTTNQETSVGITLTGSDVDTPAEQLVYQVQTNPAHGTLTGSGSSLTYTPDFNYVGSDTFTYVVNDGNSDSEPGTVQIQVNAFTPLDGWVGNRAQHETLPYVIAAPGDPLKLSAASAVTAEKVVATVGQDQVSLLLMNGETAAADGKKIWSTTNYRLSDNMAAGDLKAVFTAYDGNNQVTQQEDERRVLEDNAYHIRTEINLRGTITDQATKQPIANALVTLYDPTGTNKIGETYTTGVDGKYHFDHIKTKNYLIVIKRDGYGTKKSVISALPTDLTSTEIVRDYELVKFNLALSANPTAMVGDGVSTSTLKAVLTDKDGLPIPGVEVEFSAPRGALLDAANAPHLTQIAVTNAQGEATVTYRSEKIEGIISQNVPITAKVDDSTHNLYATEQLIVTFQPASLKGIVTTNQDADGNGKPDPVVGAIVKVTKDFDGDGIIDFTGEAVTGPDGSYSIAIPRGDSDYNIAITKTVTLDGQSKEVTFAQTAHVGVVTGLGRENFQSIKTISGIVNSKDSSGLTKLAPPVESNLLVYFKDTAGHYIVDVVTGEPKGFPVGADGVFSASNVNQGIYTLEVRYKHADGKEIIINQRADGTLPVVSVTDDGQLNIDEELIDPYGTITNASTNQPIDGVHVVLYYADTARNHGKGIAPNSSVTLPAMPGFAPNNNANPQNSDSFGNYAYMVYPQTDYYLVATKEGFNTYTSPTISVETAIVRHDFTMSPKESSSGGGGGSVSVSSTPQGTTKPVVDAATNILIGQSVYEEGSKVPVTVEFGNLSGTNEGTGTVKLELPTGVQVVDANGGKVDGSTITWEVPLQASKPTVTFKPILQLPQINGKEQQMELTTFFIYDGTLKNRDLAKSSVKLDVVSNRFGDHEHYRYITGYPDQTFKTDRSLTRAELAAIMARLIGKYDGADPGYKDVSKKHWAYGYIKAVTAEGLFAGYDDHSFKPDQPVTRAELAAVMVKFLKVNKGTPVNLHFKDIKGNWAMADMEALYRNHMLSGYEDGTVKPNSPIRRVEAVVLINQMLYRGLLADIKPTFPDVPAKYWGFGHIEESSVSHKSKWDSAGVEHFTDQLPDQVQ